MDAATLRPRPARLDAVLVVAAALVVYALAPWGSWHFDDGHHVANNPAIRSLENIPRFFTDSDTFSSLPHHRLYRPVLMTTFAIDHALWGRSARGFLVTNVLLHVLCVLTVLALARRILGRNHAALFAALVFAVHPIGSEVVNYVSARSSSLATLFSVLSILAHLQADRTRGGASAGWRGLSYALLAVGLLSKAIAVTVPILAVLASWACDSREGRERTWAQRIVPVLPMLLITVSWYFVIKAQVGAIVGGLKGRVTESIGGDHLSREKRSVLANLATQSRVFWIYVSLVLVPRDLSVDRFVRVSESFGDPLALAALLGIVALVVLVTRLRLRTLRLGVLWFGVALLPTSSLFPLLVVMNEHRLYLPMAGLALAAGAGLAWVFVRRTGRIVVPALLVVLAVLTFVRTRDWRDEFTLWSAAIRSSPGSYQAHTNLGIEYYREAMRGATEEIPGDVALLTKALKEYEIAEAIFPNWFNIPFNQGLAHLATGRATNAVADFDAAVDRFRRCLVVSPGSFRARWHLAVVDDARGRTGEALGAFEALRAQDESVTTLYHFPIGKLQGKLGRWADAEKTYREILAIETRRNGAPGDRGRLLLLRALEEQGRLEEAEERLRKLLVERPKSGRWLMALARFLRRTGRGKPGEIRGLFQRAIMMGYRPTDAEADEVLRGKSPEGSGTRGKD